MADLENHDFVILALARWDGPYSSTAFSIAKQLSLTNRVFYIDNPFTIKDIIAGRNNPQIRSRLPALLFGVNSCKQINESNNLFCVTPPLALPINFLPQGFLYYLFSRLNNIGISIILKRLIKRKNIKKFVYINIFNPFYLSTIRKFNPDSSIYYCVDNMAESKYISKHGTIYERKLMKQSDFTISTSKFLQKYATAFANRSEYLPNAADYSLFKNTSLVKLEDRPNELKSVSGKIVGYMGNIEDRLDFSLLLQIIKGNQDKTFLFIGPINSNEFYENGFNEMSNVITTGKKSIEELPTYLRFFDCAIIPFKRNDLTKGIYPLKINEYLAAGCPVVCTSFSEDIQEFKDVIKLANTAEEFTLAIKEEISSDNRSKRESRIFKASKNTWENRVLELKKLIAQYSTTK